MSTKAAHRIMHRTDAHGSAGRWSLTTQGESPTCNIFTDTKIAHVVPPVLVRHVVFHHDVDNDVTKIRSIQHYSQYPALFKGVL